MDIFTITVPVVSNLHWLFCNVRSILGEKAFRH